MSNFEDLLADRMKNPAFADAINRARAETDLGFALSLAREARNMSPADVATAAGIPVAMVTRVETGQVVELASLAKIAVALNARITIEPSGKVAVKLN